MEEIVKEITKRIRNQENGVVVADMERNGIRYQRNFGVSIVQLRQFATQYNLNQELAEALWDKNWRETQILATLIADPEKISSTTINTWVKDCVNSELIEQISLNLLTKIPDAIEYVERFLQKEDENFLSIGCTTLAHIAFRQKNLSSDTLEAFIPSLLALSKKATINTRRPIALALRRIGRKNRTLNQLIIEENLKLKSFDNIHSKWIAEDVSVELTDEFIVNSLAD